MTGSSLLCLIQGTAACFGPNQSEFVTSCETLKNIIYVLQHGEGVWASFLCCKWSEDDIQI